MSDQSRQNFNTCTIAMLLLEGFNSAAAHAFIDPFRAANYLRGETIYRWPMLSLDGEPVTASNGMTLSSDAALNAVLMIGWMVRGRWARAARERSA